MKGRRLWWALLVFALGCAGCFSQPRSVVTADVAIHSDAAGLDGQGGDLSKGDLVAPDGDETSDTLGDAIEPVDGLVESDGSEGDDALDADTTPPNDGADSVDDTDVVVEIDVPKPHSCVLTLEHVATVSGYSYAASIDLDTTGQPHITYSSNTGGFKGSYAFRQADGNWVRYTGIFTAARLFVQLENGVVPTVIGYDGAFGTSLYRLSDEGFFYDPPLIVSPKEDERSLYDSIGLGGTSHLVLVNGADTRVIRVDGETLTPQTVTPALNSPNLGRLAANAGYSRSALYYLGPDPTAGPVVADGLYRFENGSSTLASLILFGSSAFAPILDAHGSGLDQILYVRRDAETSLHLLNLGGDSPTDELFSLPEGTHCPEMMPSDSTSTECTENYQRYALSLDGLPGTGGANHYVVGREDVTDVLSYVDMRCYPCDPLPGSDICPPYPRCDEVPGPAHIITQQVRTTLALVFTPGFDQQAPPLLADLWASGMTLQHIRAARDAKGMLHIVTTARGTAPISGGATEVFYLKVDPSLCF
ncbi:MAG: hypothetical protein KC609_16590 [Myxococcales bacterium]|nr:hypothetical protein [Myxococcales bacterium]